MTHAVRHQRIFALIVLVVVLVALVVVVVVVVIILVVVIVVVVTVVVVVVVVIALLSGRRRHRRRHRHRRGLRCLLILRLPHRGEHLRLLRLGRRLLSAQRAQCRRHHAFTNSVRLDEAGEHCRANECGARFGGPPAP